MEGNSHSHSKSSSSSSSSSSSPAGACPPDVAIAIDLLGGSAALRREVETGADLRDIQARWDAESADFLACRARFLVYA